MRGRSLYLCAGLLSSAAFAGDAPLYQKPPAWVEVAELKQAQQAADGPFLIHDIQVRAEDGVVTTYADFAMTIDSPQALTQLGTLTAQWLPEKGDLTVHRAALVRAGQEIDLLERSKFTVLRREQELEQRTLTGMLTATMPVAGAQIGDVVRLGISVSMRDEALAGEIQADNPVPYLPVAAGIGRLRLSWPMDEAMRVGAGPRFDLPPPVTKAGYRQVEIAFDRKKPEDMPGDAPGRFHAPPVVALTSFADWAEVSRTMGSLFATAGTIAPDGPIAAEIARITRETANPRERAAAALRLVQDRIAYLAQGMDGGNYVPQSPDRTWETRYGDCKAKTLLLTAMLREMGIDAAPVLVNTQRGDAVAEGLPRPGAFDHVIVRAVVDGRDLWLDGTAAGAQTASLEDAPPFAWGLPLTEQGTGLVALPNRAPALPSVSIVNRIDLSAGIDFPALYDLRVDVTGAGAAMLQQLAKMPPSEQRDELIDGMVSSIMGGGENFERSISYDASSGIASITAKGMDNSYFDRSGRQAEYAPNLLSNGLRFEGNRSRAAWRDIPVALMPADRRKTDITVALPALEGFTLTGGTLQAAAAGATVSRQATLTGSTLRIVEEVASTGGELAPSDIPAEKARYAALSANPLRLRAPIDAPRAWDATVNSARLKPILDAYARLIAANQDESGFYIGRASFYSGMRDYKRAIADYDKAIELDPAADNYFSRAVARKALGDFAGAIADTEKASELDPSGARVVDLALTMAIEGKSADALTLVERALEQGGGDERPALIEAQATLLARLSRTDEGRAALVKLIEERPGDAVLMNALCWFGGLWQTGMDSLAADCDAAVTASNFAPGVLDSRALANYRLGRLQAALADTNAALLRNPGQDPTLLLRGIIRSKLGEKAGAADIAEALRRRPGLRQEYAGYGLLPLK